MSTIRAWHLPRRYSELVRLAGVLLVFRIALHDVVFAEEIRIDDFVQSLGLEDTSVRNLIREERYTEYAIKHAGGSPEELRKNLRAYYDSRSRTPAQQTAIIKTIREALEKTPPNLRLYEAALRLVTTDMRERPDLVPIVRSVAELDAPTGEWEESWMTAQVNSMSYLSAIPTLGTNLLKRYAAPEFWINKDFHISESVSRQAITYRLAAGALHLVVDSLPIDEANTVLTDLASRARPSMVPQSTDERLRASELEAIQRFQSILAEGPRNMERRRQGEPIEWSFDKHAEDPQI